MGTAKGHRKGHEKSWNLRRSEEKEPWGDLLNTTFY